MSTTEFRPRARTADINARGHGSQIDPAPDEQLRWSEPVHRRHAGELLDDPQAVLLGHAWSYEPAACPTGFRVVALRVADGTFVCPLCGLRTS